MGPFRRFTVLLLGSSPAFLPLVAQEIPSDSKQILRQRQQLDESVWQPERVAQQYEEAVVRLWDQLRSADSALNILLEIDSGRWALPSKATRDSLDLGIERLTFAAEPAQTVDDETFGNLLRSYEAKGWALSESEFHHTRFQPAKAESPAESEIAFLLHLENRKESPARRAIVKGNAFVTWPGGPSAAKIVAQAVRLSDLKILNASAESGFVKAATFEPGPDQFQSGHPVLLNDVDQDGDAEIILPRWNRRYDNALASDTPRLNQEAFLEHWQPQEECGLLADFTNDGHVDYVTVTKGKALTLYRGTAGGKFPHRGEAWFTDDALRGPLALTAGDLDGDGDLDLWLTQYKPSYVGGQMPTPFYDANDGFPSFLLRNDGAAFTDITATAGLFTKRHRRTYSSSLVDLDSDRDLDLVVVSDYAGLDVYENNGKGQFRDISSNFQPNRLFGMAHALADFDGDALMDLYAIGMSSSTARRLDGMGLGLENRKDYQTYRSEMGYGNRMYLRRNQGFTANPKNDQVARTGWSWGVSAFDFDNDADRDLYVANGFRSGKSAKDYCTYYWCHDLYTGNSRENGRLIPVFQQSMLDLNRGLMSWNGYEHNHLKMNLGELDFENIAFLFGASFEYDARVVLTEDFNRDGREDLLVTEYPFVGGGFQSKVHLYLNTIRTPNHWIAVQLQPSEHSPAMGATVTLHSKRGRQIHALVSGDAFLSQDAFTAHFGLGTETSVQRIEISWPGGQTTALHSPASDRVHLVRAEAK